MTVMRKTSSHQSQPKQPKQHRLQQVRPQMQHNNHTPTQMLSQICSMIMRKMSMCLPYSLRHSRRRRHMHLMLSRQLRTLKEPSQTCLMMMRTMCQVLSHSLQRMCQKSKELTLLERTNLRKMAKLIVEARTPANNRTKRVAWTSQRHLLRPKKLMLWLHPIRP